ncbi:hypothetical protein FS749_001981 [Ceratobasidium sp. UAMH 11750]|nr:hypothetical protein FS749_001981 [Ceratobasidium sp. UAMH 11750]
MALDDEFEAFKAFAASRGFALQPIPPATSVQPTQQTAPPPPAATIPLAATIPPAASIPPLGSAALARRIASKQRAVSAQLPAPSQPSVPTQPATLTQPAVPARRAASAQPAVPQKATQPAMPAQPTRPIQHAAPVHSTAPTVPVRLAATTAPICLTAPAGSVGNTTAGSRSSGLVARRNTGSLLRQRPTPMSSAPAPAPSHAPAPGIVSIPGVVSVPGALSETTAPDNSVFLSELTQIRAGGGVIRIAFIGAEPQVKGRKSALNIKRLLKMDPEGWTTVRRLVKTCLQKTSGINMTLSYTRQESLGIIQRACRRVLPVLPEFEVYAGHDYWPLNHIAQTVLRTASNNHQSRRRARARREQAEANPQEEAEDEDADDIIEDMEEPEVTPINSANPEPQPGTARNETVNAPVTTEDDMVADLTQNIGNMSVDPVSALFDDEVNSEPFTLPAEFAGGNPIQASSTPSQPTPSFPPASPEPSPLVITSTVTSTATSGSFSNATSTVSATGASTLPVAPTTPTRAPTHIATSPDLLAKLRKLTSLSAAQCGHLPPAFLNILQAMDGLDPNLELDTEAILAATPASNNGVVPPPYPGRELEPDPDTDDLGSTGDSEDPQADLEGMDVDKVEGPSGGKGGRKKGNAATGKKGSAATGKKGGASTGQAGEKGAAGGPTLRVRGAANVEGANASAGQGGQLTGPAARPRRANAGKGITNPAPAPPPAKSKARAKKK